MTIREIAAKISRGYAAGLSGMDPPVLQALVELGDQADAIATLELKYDRLLDLLRVLNGYGHFDPTHAESDDTYADTKLSVREILAEPADQPVRIFTLVEDGKGGFNGQPFTTRTGAEVALRRALGEYSSDARPVFTADQIEAEIVALREAHARNEHHTIEVADRASLWIDVCQVTA